MSAAASPAGAWTLCHDGWYGFLRLEADAHAGGGRELEGWFADARSGRRYTVRAAAGDEGGLAMTFLRFGQAARQEFAGRIFGRRAEAMAGTTHWRDIPFGFFARRAPFAHLRRFGAFSDRVERTDACGRYTFWHAAGVGTLDIAPGARGLVGRYEGGGGAVDVRVGMGGDHDHEVRLAFDLDGRPFEGKGHLFTRPKNGVAGGATWGGQPTAFYLTKFAAAP